MQLLLDSESAELVLLLYPKSLPLNGRLHGEVTSRSGRFSGVIAQHQFSALSLLQGLLCHALLLIEPLLHAWVRSVWLSRR